LLAFVFCGNLYQLNDFFTISIINKMALLETTGKLTLLRVHDVGTKYGPPNDEIDVEVVVWLDSQPNQAFGFQLRNDGNGLARQGMLDLFRDAFAKNSRVTFDYSIDTQNGRKNGVILRVWLSK
jgi:hypothetical protein